jgi:hypothetical protein
MYTSTLMTFMFPYVGGLKKDVDLEVMLKIECFNVRTLS